MEEQSGVYTKWGEKGIEIVLRWIVVFFVNFRKGF